MDPDPSCSILLSCVIFVHPLSLTQWAATCVIFGALYMEVRISCSLQPPRCPHAKPTTLTQPTPVALPRPSRYPTLALSTPV